MTRDPAQLHLLQALQEHVRQVFAPRRAYQFLAMIAAAVTTVVLISSFMVLAVAGAPVAEAAYSTTGAGTGAVTTGTLPPSTRVTVPATTSGAVPVSWTAPATGLTPITYQVTRSTNNTSFPACGTTASTRITATNCTDNPPTVGPHTYTVTAVHRSWTTTSAPSTAVTLTAGQLTFTVQPADVAAGAAINPPVQVSLQSTQGVPIPTSNQQITLAIGANPGGSSLTGTLTALTNANGTATFNNLHLDKGGTGYTLTATSTGLPVTTSGTFNVMSSMIVFTTTPTTGPASATAGQGPITIQRTDGNGAPVPAPAGGLTLTLASTTAGTPTFSTTRNGPATSTITIPAGSSTATFYYGDTRAGNPVVWVSSNGTVAASQPQTITAAAASRLAFTTPSVTGTASTAADTGPLTLQLQDTFGNPATTPAAATTIGLTSTSTGTTRFSTVQGSSTNSAVSIPAGATSVSFYYGDTRAGTATITASATGLTSASQTLTITAPAATQLAVTSPAVTGTASTTTTTGPITVQLRDAAGAPVPAPNGGVTLTLTSTTTGTPRFSPVQGSPTTGAVIIPAGATSITFYYADTRAGTPTITITAPGLTGTSQTTTIRAAAPSRLTYLTAPTSAVAATTASAGPLTIRLEDTFGNPTSAPTGGTSVTLTSTSAGTRTFALTRGSATSTPTITIPAAATSVTFYYGDTAAGTPTITATPTGTTGITSAAQQQTVSPAAPARVQFLQPPTNVRKGATFTPLITALIVDRFGNRTTSTAAVTIELRTSTGGAGARGNLGGATTVTAVNGLATFADLTIGGPASGTYTLLITSTPLTNALSPTFTVT